MRGRRTLYWSLALADLRADRVQPRDIREERLRTQSTRALDLSCWRGRSGRRYVVTVQPLGAAPIEVPDIVYPRPLVALAVRRDAGVARIVAVGSFDWLQRWQAGAVREGATELHLYRLAETTAERFAVIEDLRELPPVGGDTRHSAREGVS